MSIWIGVLAMRACEGGYKYRGWGYFDTVILQAGIILLFQCYRCASFLHSRISLFGRDFCRLRQWCSSYVESPHIWTQLCARQPHEPVVPLQEINPLQPLLLLDRGSPRVTINPLIKRQGYLPLRLDRLQIKLLVSDSQTQRSIDLREDVADGDEVCRFADDVQRPWNERAFDLEVGSGRGRGRLAECGFREAHGH